MHLGELFLRQAAFRADDIAIVLIKKNGERVTYSWEHFSKKALSMKSLLEDRGVKKNDFVAIVPINSPESFFALWGIILLGAIPVPINPRSINERGLVDIKKILSDCRPGLILTSRCLASRLQEHKIDTLTIEGLLDSANTTYLIGKPLTIKNNCGSDQKSILIMPYTSGTSGNPKGVRLTHGNVFDRIEAVSHELAVSADDRILSYLPLGHISELIATFFGQVYGGYTIFFTEYAEEGVLDIEKFRTNFSSILQEVKPTVFLAVPRIWGNFRKKIEKEMRESRLPIRWIPKALIRYLIKRKLGFDRARKFISAGSRLDQEAADFFEKLLDIKTEDIYGQTETAGPLTINGKSIGGNVRISVNAEGEIVVSGNCVMAGYYQNPKADSKVFANQTETGRREYHTGDTGFISSGRILWAGRIDGDFKLANGEKINTAKRELLEEQIKKIDPQINEVLICGANRPHLIALIFSDSFQDPHLHAKISLHLSRHGVGEGIYRVRDFAIVPSANLKLTSSMKIKRSAILTEMEPTISSLYK